MLLTVLMATADGFKRCWPDVSGFPSKLARWNSRNGNYKSNNVWTPTYAMANLLLADKDIHEQSLRFRVL